MVGESLQDCGLPGDPNLGAGTQRASDHDAAATAGSGYGTAQAGLGSSWRDLYAHSAPIPHPTPTARLYPRTTDMPQPPRPGPQFQEAEAQRKASQLPDPVMQPETTAAARAADWVAKNTPPPIRVTFRTARRWPAVLAGLGVGLVLAWAAAMTWAAWYQLEYRVVIERHVYVHSQPEGWQVPDQDEE